MKLLDGTVDDMMKQKEFLESKGIFVSSHNGIPAVDTLKYKNVLEMLYHNNISGWQNYKDDLTELGICNDI